MRFLRGFAAHSRDDRLALAGLSLLLVAGLALRLLCIARVAPGLLGFPDSSVYLEAAYGEFELVFTSFLLSILGLRRPE